MNKRPAFDGFRGQETPTPEELYDDPNQIAAEERRQKIRTANDVFRKTATGDFFLTSGVVGLGQEDESAILTKVRQFSSFAQTNDPWGEHDFGSFHHGSHRIYWKIDYYDRALEGGSPDPSDGSLTRRVMTIMLSSEY